MYINNMIQPQNLILNQVFWLSFAFLLSFAYAISVDASVEKMLEKLRSLKAEGKNPVVMIIDMYEATEPKNFSLLNKNVWGGKYFEASKREFANMGHFLEQVKSEGVQIINVNYADPKKVDTSEYSVQEIMSILQEKRLTIATGLQEKLGDYPNVINVVKTEYSAFS